MKPRIIIEISGGVCVAVYADRPVNVSVLDHDNMEGIDPDDASCADELAEYQKLESETKKLKAYY